MAYANGKDGKVSLVGYGAGSSAGSLIVLCVKKWEADIKKDKHDTSSTCNTAWKTTQIGKKVVEFTIDFQYDLANGPIGSAFNIQTDYAAVSLFADATASAMFVIPTAVVDSIKITSAENDIISGTLTGSSSGTVTING